MSAPGPPPGVYELTVAGRLGPVLQAMFEPATTTSCEHLTIMCLRGQGGKDLVDVLELLGSRGLDVANIHTLR
jgi:hypothetical protein